MASALDISRSNFHWTDICLGPAREAWLPRNETEKYTGLYKIADLITRLVSSIFAMTLWLPFTCIGLIASEYTLKKREVVVVPSHENHDDSLEQAVQLSLESHEDEVANRSNTVADGSCAFHVLLGELDENNQWRCLDKKEARDRFCAWLRGRFYSPRGLPFEILNVLEDFIINFKEAPSPFQEEIKKSVLFDKYIRDYSSLSATDQDILKGDWLKDGEVFNIYIEYLVQEGTYLSQDEFLAAAQCFGKTVDFSQSDWGAGAMVRYNQLNASNSEPIHVFYNSSLKHYERAVLQ